MREKLPKIILIVILILIFGNLVWLDYGILKESRKRADVEKKSESKGEGETIVEEETEQEVESGKCSEECQKIIEEKVAEAISNLPTQSPAKVTYIVPTSAPAKETKVSYIPLIAEGSTINTTWTDVTPSDFYFDSADYTGLKNVRFEVYLKSKHQAGRVYVRLYDVTNKRAVDYSDLSSNSETYELQRSSDLVIWQGNNLYRIQAKTLNGIEGYLKEAKPKITF